MKRELLSKAFGDMDESFVREAYRPVPEDASGAPERITHMKKKRMITFALAAALILALGIAAYAASGIPRSTGTHLMPRAAEYTSLSDLPEIEKDLGCSLIVPESFSNGYAFAKLRVDGQAVFGESNEVLEKFYAVRASYSKAGAQELTLHLSPVLEYEGGHAAPEPSERRTVGGVTVDLNFDHYKVVPEEYTKTEDDLAREAAGHYYLSFGSDKIEEHDIASADFELEGVHYTLMDMTANAASFDTLIQMAEELITSADA